MKWLGSLLGLGGWQTYLVAGMAAVLLATLGWAVIERRGAAEQRERAVRAEGLAEANRLAAVANAAVAEANRKSAEEAQADLARLMASRADLRSRVVTIVKEVAREPDARDPVPAAVRAGYRRLRELDAATRAGVAPGAAPAPVRPAGGPEGRATAPAR